MIVAKQDGICRGANQPLVSRVSAREERYPSRLLKGQQPSPFNHIGLASGNDDGRDVEWREPLYPREKCFGSSVSLEIPHGHEERPGAERQGATPSDNPTALGLSSQIPGAESGWQRWVADWIIWRIVAAKADRDDGLI